MRRGSEGARFRSSTDRMHVHVGPSADVAWSVMETETRIGQGKPRVQWSLIVFRKESGAWRIAATLIAPKKGR